METFRDFYWCFDNDASYDRIPVGCNGELERGRGRRCWIGFTRVLRFQLETMRVWWCDSIIERKWFPKPYTSTNQSFFQPHLFSFFLLCSLSDLCVPLFLFTKSYIHFLFSLLLSHIVHRKDLYISPTITDLVSNQLVNLHIYKQCFYVLWARYSTWDKPIGRR